MTLSHTFRRIIALTVGVWAFAIICLFFGNFYTDWNFEGILLGLAIYSIAHPRIVDIIAVFYDVDINKVKRSMFVHINVVATLILTSMMFFAYALMVQVLFPRFG